MTEMGRRCPLSWAMCYVEERNRTVLCHFGSGYHSLTIVSSLDVLSLTPFLCSAVYNIHRRTTHPVHYLKRHGPGTQNTCALTWTIKLVSGLETSWSCHLSSFRLGICKINGVH